MLILGEPIGYGGRVAVPIEELPVEIGKLDEGRLKVGTEDEAPDDGLGTPVDTDLETGEVGKKEDSVPGIVLEFVNGGLVGTEVEPLTVKVDERVCV